MSAAEREAFVPCEAQMFYGNVNVYTPDQYFNRDIPLVSIEASSLSDKPLLPFIPRVEPP